MSFFLHIPATYECSFGFKPPRSYPWAHGGNWTMMHTLRYTNATSMSTGHHTTYPSLTRSNASAALE